MDDTSGRINELLRAWNEDGRAGLDGLLPLLYKELRRLAQASLRSERNDHTLQATALVHEAYLRLVHRSVRNAETKAQFVAIAAQAMRRVLVDHARRKRARKRGGTALPAREGQASTSLQAPDVLELDLVLTELANRDARQARIVELRFFGGLAIEETASVLGISAATVSREWHVAKAWLRRELSR